jgi:2-polyprenyl-3-methyl-5-hydroxy-6-metoxy-1,4-benzoquinol methylase
MSAPGILAPSSAAYWEQRAQRFADRGEGLAAVCSYGMPDLYNRAIQLSQRLALAPWLKVPAGTRALDVGCGVGRWSRLLAARGAQVSGVDLSPTMIEIAQRRAAAAGLGERCRFTVQDLAELQLDGCFDLVLGVTVLQHILEPTRLRTALRRMVEHLAPQGRMVLLEAAPIQGTRRCDSTVFTARQRHTYVELFRDTGLRLRALQGVDPAPFRTWLLPHLQHLPASLHWTASTAASVLSLPFDALLGRRAVGRSWHALFVLEHAGGTRAH